MSVFGIITAAFGLSADAFTVAVCKGMGLKRYDLRYALTAAALFGGFQAVMPLVGYLLGSALRQYVLSFGRFIAFAVLAFIGGKMIFDSLHDDREIVISHSLTYSDYAELLSLAVATSIDALTVGVTFAFLNVNVLTASMIIGIVTFAMSLFGVWAGFRLGVSAKYLWAADGAAINSPLQQSKTGAVPGRLSGTYLNKQFVTADGAATNSPLQQSKTGTASGRLSGGTASGRLSGRVAAAGGVLLILLGVKLLIF